MVDILHRVGVKSSVEQVYSALTTRDGLAGWWTTDTQGDSQVGGVLRFRFHVDGREIGSTKWATFLMSLKSLVETGRGAPSPDDVRIGNWHRRKGFSHVAQAD